jgi:hypothetical protein
MSFDCHNQNTQGFPMNRFLIAPIALACTRLCGVSAQAANVAVSGFANGSKSVNVLLSNPNTALNLTTDAGGFSTSLNGGASFTTYCIDLYENISFGTTYSGYTLGAGALHAFANSHAAADIGKLFAENNAITTATAQAAFQIAVWEIAYETTGLYNLDTGSAKFSGGTAASSGALTMASSWLSSLATTTNNSTTLWTLDSVETYGHQGHQDLAFAAAVPEPTTYAMLAGGLLCVGFYARRRGSRQS